MLMICWFYCAPLFHWLFFASSALLMVYASFILKRGIRQNRKGLREIGLALIYLIVIKLFTFDANYIARELFCENAQLGVVCSERAISVFRIFAGLLLIPSSYGMFRLYRHYINRVVPASKTLISMRIRTWANIGMLLVLILVTWLVSPWIGYLTVGHTEQFLLSPLWRYFGLLCFAIIGFTFWMYEDCSLIARTKEDRASRHKSWMPRDTLWLATALLVITYLFFFVSEDFLLGRM